MRHYTRHGVACISQRASERNQRFAVGLDACAVTIGVDLDQHAGSGDRTRCFDTVRDYRKLRAAVDEVPRACLLVRGETDRVEDVAIAALEELFRLAQRRHGDRRPAGSEHDVRGCQRLGGLHMQAERHAELRKARPQPLSVRRDLAPIDNEARRVQFGKVGHRGGHPFLRAGSSAARTSLNWGHVFHLGMGAEHPARGTYGDGSAICIVGMYRGQFGKT